jgi:hypothetical protein
MTDEMFDETVDVSDPGVISVTLPKLTNWTISQIYDYNSSIIDYNTLNELDTTVNKARKALFLLTEKINEYERKEKAAKVRYDRAFRRALLSSSEKTESMKRARAELVCEDLENEWLTFDQLKSELNRTSFTMRLELQTLQAIGNNLRQQLKTL